MKKTKLQLMMWTCLAIIFAISCDKDTEITPAKFFINKSNHQFESIEVGQTSSVELVVTNKGGDLLELNKFTLSGNNPNSFTTIATTTKIKADKSYKFVVKFSPTKVGNHTATLTITSSVGKHTVQLSGTAKAKPVPVFAINPTTFEFTATEIGKQQNTKFTITNNGTADLELKQFSFTGTNKADFTTDAVAKTLAPSKDYSFNVTFKPTIIGDKTAALNIENNAENGVVNITAKAIAAKVPVFDITPDAYNFDAVEIGKSATYQFTITNSGTTDLELSNLTFNGDNKADFTTDAVAKTLAPKQTYEFTITFKPTTVGDKMATLNIIDNDGNHSIALTGKGKEAAVTGFAITPDKHSFGDVEVGKSVTKEFTVTNNGTADLKLTAFTFTSMDNAKADFTTDAVAKTIAPNATYKFNVTFTPSVAGQKAVMLNITDNAGNHTVGMSANATVATAAGFAITPDKHSFGDVEVGKSVTQAFTVTNNGTADLKLMAFTFTSMDNAKADFTTDATAKTIAPKATYKFNVTFKPTVAGQKAVMLNITDNAGNHTVGMTANATVATAAGFAITPDKHNFGDVEVGKSVTQAFTVTNNGTADLKLKAFTFTSMDNAKADFTTDAVAKTIAPNSTYKFNVTFKPTTAGQKAVMLNITDNAGNHTVGMTANATVATAAGFAITPDKHNFGDVEVGKSVTQAFTVTNNGTADLKLTAFTFTSMDNAKADFTTDATAKTIAPNSNYKFNVTFKPTVAGQKAVILNITDNAGNHTVGMTANATVATAAGFAITPDKHNFGDVEVGKSVTQAFTVTNNGTADLKLTAFTFTSADNAKADFTTDAVAKTIAPNGTYKFNVTFKPTAAGQKAVMLNITDNAGNHTVGISGTATTVPKPVMTITPNPHDFGKVEKGTTQTKVFVIANTGSANLKVSAVTFSGANKAFFSSDASMPKIIYPTKTYSFTVTFNPTKVGKINASLDVTSNADNQNITLTAECFIPDNINDVVNIPDTEFKKYLIGNKEINLNSDTEIQVSEAKAFTGEINIKYKAVKNLTGIEAFTELTILSGVGKLFKDGSVLDVSKNTKLKELDARGIGGVAVIDLRNNPNLEYFSCSRGGMTTGDVTTILLANNKKLKKLICNNNKVPTLDLSSCEALEQLYIGSNKFTNIDLSHNLNLEVFSCSQNEFTSLDVSSNKKLEELHITSTNLGGGNSKLSSLKIGTLPMLKTLDCCQTRITALDVSNCTELKTLTVHNNRLTQLNVDNCSELYNLYCYNNKLTQLNLSTNSQLSGVYCNGNRIASLDFSNSDKIYTINCYNNKLMQLNLAYTEKLSTLKCYENELTQLDISDCKALRVLNCADNQLTALNTANNKELKNLDCHNNSIASFDLTSNAVLNQLYAKNNQLTTLSIKSNAKLGILNVDNNQLTSIEFGTKLPSSIYCNNNKLTELDIHREEANIVYLQCAENSITALDLSNCTKMRQLICNNNKLTSLDISNTSMTSGSDNFNCQYNPLNCIKVSQEHLDNHYGWKIDTEDKLSLTCE